MHYFICLGTCMHTSTHFGLSWLSFPSDSLDFQSIGSTCKIWLDLNNLKTFFAVTLIHISIISNWFLPLPFPHIGFFFFLPEESFYRLHYIRPLFWSTPIVNFIVVSTALTVPLLFLWTLNNPTGLLDVLWICSLVILLIR